MNGQSGDDVLPRRLRERIRRFLAKPLREKYASVASRLRSRVVTIPLPIRLPFGAWWIARNDNIGKPLREGQFETAEVAFVDRYLQPGMTVLDIGAHHGLYTLLASLRVGNGGLVYSFEPSARERKALLQHVRINRCKNVSVQDAAIGNENNEATLYVVEGSQSGCNSLRPPVVTSGTSSVRIKVARLDDWLREQSIDRVDFIKLDVEGGEREALLGAERLIECFRPVLFAEVQDIRTRPWGYPAKEIIEQMIQKKYRWFDVTPDGFLSALDVRAKEFDGNFVACPEERLPKLQKFVEGASG